MIRTPVYRTNLIGQAESLASGLVALTERERAAYRAAFLADPYSRCTFERAHRRAATARDDAFEALIEACDELCREGLGTFAVNLQGNAVKRCAVAIDVAAFELLRELDSLPDTDPRKDSSREPQGTESRTPEARPGRPADAAGSLSDLQPPDPPRPQGRARAVLCGPAPAGATEGGVRCD